MSGEPVINLFESKIHFEVESKKRFVIDLFAGCGGLATGLELAGFNPALVCEIDQDARQSYLMNRFSWLGNKPFKDLEEFHYADAHELDNRRINLIKKKLSILEPELTFGSGKRSTLDLVCGGPPCQGFSGIGIRRSYAVDKCDLPANQLYDQMASIIEAFNPKIFLFENVRGILTGRWSREDGVGRIWTDVWNRFSNLKGYEVRWSLVKAKDYGVPQNRPRVLIVGIRKDIYRAIKLPKLMTEDAIDSGFLPSPSHNAPDLEDLLSDLVDPQIESDLKSQQFRKPFATTRYKSTFTNPIQKWFRTKPDGTSLEKGSSVSEHEYSRHAKRIVDKFALMIEGADLPEEMRTKKFAQRVLPRKWGEAGPTITATSLPDDYVHYCQARSLTVREWARLQMFPDWYQFAGKRTTGGLRRAGNPVEGQFGRETPKYTQIGNAVPVGLAYAVGIHFLKLLEESENEESS